MTSFQCSSSINQYSPNPLRRSDRKRTKKIFKDDFMLPNPFKGKLKKHKGLRLPQNLGSQIRKIQFLTERTLATLNYGKQQFSIQMLNQMKQAVNQQQIKLSQFLSIKLTGEKNVQQNKIHLNFNKIQKIIKEKQNTPKIQQNTHAGQCHNEHDFHKEVLGIATAQQLYHTLSGIHMHEQDHISAFNQQSEFCMVQAPKFRKQSSKLLSDNYQNHELMYNIQQLIPNWHGQQIQLHSEVQFSD